MNTENLDFMKSKGGCIVESDVPKNRNQTEEKVIKTTSQPNGNSDSKKSHFNLVKNYIGTSDKSKSTSNYFNDYFLKVELISKHVYCITV